MALTGLQREVCRLLAAARRESGESYIAGGVALSIALSTSRLSRDLDVFHDTTEAVARSWDRDRTILESAGYAVTSLRERPGYVEAAVARQGRDLIMEWARDSAFRFFPLVEDEDLGLVLHPFDLATNKVLALVGRVEARDWIDVIACHERLQPLGYLAWAACGKDPGFTPSGILEQARRSSRYTDDEVSSLAFEGPVIDRGRRALVPTSLLCPAEQLRLTLFCFRFSRQMCPFIRVAFQVINVSRLLLNPKRIDSAFSLDTSDHVVTHNLGYEYTLELCTQAATRTCRIPNTEEQRAGTVLVHRRRMIWTRVRTRLADGGLPKRHPMFVDAVPQERIGDAMRSLE
jgi:hypothetical protein